MLYRSIRRRMLLIYQDINEGRQTIAREDLERLQAKLGPQPFLTAALRVAERPIFLNRREIQERLRSIPVMNYPEQQLRRVQVPHG